MMSIEAEQIARRLKIHVGKIMKPYDLPVLKFLVSPNGDKEIANFLNMLSMRMNPEVVTRSYSDFTVLAVFENQGWRPIEKWSKYDHFLTENNINL